MMPLAITNLRGRHTDTYVADKKAGAPGLPTTVYVLVTYNLC